MMMHSVRITTKWHGNANLYILAFNLLVTSLLIWNFGINYLVIFLSSSILHILIESGLTISGIRKGRTYVNGIMLPRILEILLRSFVEGPAFCVPAFFIADQFLIGNYFFSLTASVIIVGAASLYLAFSDKRNYKRAKNSSDAIISRRAMTSPKAVMLLALINTACLIAIFSIQSENRTHALIYLLSYSAFVLLFYFIHYNFNVRFIEIYDPIKQEFSKPGVLMQIAGLTYDSAYEMALLVSPAYWVVYYLGGFQL